MGTAKEGDAASEATKGQKERKGSPGTEHHIS